MHCPRRMRLVYWLSIKKVSWSLYAVVVFIFISIKIDLTTLSDEQNEDNWQTSTVTLTSHHLHRFTSHNVHLSSSIMRTKQANEQTSSKAPTTKPYPSSATLFNEQSTIAATVQTVKGNQQDTVRSTDYSSETIITTTDREFVTTQDDRIETTATPVTQGKDDSETTMVDQSDATSILTTLMSSTSASSECCSASNGWQENWILAFFPLSARWHDFHLGWTIIDHTSKSLLSSAIVDSDQRGHNQEDQQDQVSQESSSQWRWRGYHWWTTIFLIHVSPWLHAVYKLLLLFFSIESAMINVESDCILASTI